MQCEFQLRGKRREQILSTTCYWRSISNVFLCNFPSICYCRFPLGFNKKNWLKVHQAKKKHRQGTFNGRVESNVNGSYLNTDLQTQCGEW